VCPLGLDLWNFGSLVFSILLVLWGLFMDMEKEKRLRVLAKVHAVPVALWRWTAAWKWDVIFSLGWGLMLASGEYALCLVCLGLASLGAFSGATHWCREKKKGAGAMVIFLVGIAGATGLLVVVTIANKAIGNKPWSPSLNLIDSRSAEHKRWPVPFSPAPWWKPLTPSLPMARTPREVLREAQKAAEDSKKAKQLGVTDKARFEVSFWPVKIGEWPILRKTILPVNGVVTVDLTMMVKDHMAKNTKLWLRLCKGCMYAKEPAGFKNLIPPDNEAHERLIDIGDFLPNVVYAPIISFDVVPPFGQNYFTVGVNVGCENCAPVDVNGFQILRVDIQP